MAKLTTAEFIEAIKELSVLELNDLVKACEEEFGVSVLQQQQLQKVEQQQKKKMSSTQNLFLLEHLKLKLSKLFVKSQDLDLKKLKNQLTEHRRQLKKVFLKLKLKKSKQNLKLKEQKLTLSNFGYHTVNDKSVSRRISCSDTLF